MVVPIDTFGQLGANVFGEGLLCCVLDALHRAERDEQFLCRLLTDARDVRQLGLQRSLVAQLAVVGERGLASLRVEPARQPPEAAALRVLRREPESLVEPREDAGAGDARPGGVRNVELVGSEVEGVVRALRSLAKVPFPPIPNLDTAAALRRCAPPPVRRPAPCG